MNALLNLLLPMLFSAGEEALKKFGQSLIDEHGAKAKQFVASLYPVLDVAVEDFVATTGTTIDDDAVKRLKSVCEALAQANGFTLSNVDGD